MTRRREITRAEARAIMLCETFEPRARHAQLNEDCYCGAEIRVGDRVIFNKRPRLVMHVVCAARLDFELSGPAKSARR